MTKKSTKKQVILLDLGCGDSKITPQMAVEQALINEEDKNHLKIIGIDLHKVPSVDLKFDLTKFPYPFKAGSVDAIFSSHFLEHLDGEQRIKFFNEAYRILKPDGKMRLIHPYYKSARAVQDPTHKWPPICEQSYMYWSKAFRETNKLGHYLGDCNFEYNMFYTFMDPIWTLKNEETRNFAINHYFNVVADMIVDLVKK